MVITRRPTLELVNSSNKNELDMFFRKGSRVRCGPTLLLIKGLILTIIGILLMIWTPFQLIMDERLRMHRGLPPFEWWQTPPDLLILRARVFNYTNVDKFMAGIDDKLHIEEVGPIIYKEKLTHSNVTFNANNTITYVANHTAEYMPELNHLSLNDTIIVPNYALLSMVTYLYDAPFFAKLGFNMLVRRLRTKMFLKVKLQDFLWNFTDPIVDVANNLVPRIVPVNNLGMLHRIYERFEDTVTMYIGAEHGAERFSLIDKFSGSDGLPCYKTCSDKLTNATEGVTYHQYLTKESVLKYWRKTVCKVIKLNFEKEMVHSGFNAYKYTIPNSTYDRTYPAFNDCYKGLPDLPNGLSDVSNCMYSVPIAVSFPHFLYGAPKIKEFVTGMKPDVTKHDSYVIAEPVTGVPLESIARSQSNLIVRKLSGFNLDIMKFSDLTLPMFWLEYHQIGIPLKVQILTYISVVITPPGQIVLILLLLVIGFLYVIRFGRLVTETKQYQNLTVTGTPTLEHETFLKQTANNAA